MSKIFKFGGASVKNADAVRNVAEVIKLYPEENLGIVISAMGKTTNALEEILISYFDQKNDFSGKLNQIKKYHLDIAEELFPDRLTPVFTELENVFEELEIKLQKKSSASYDYEYDQIVCIGEIISTLIVSAYLNSISINCTWIDARSIIKTSNRYRDAQIIWETTSVLTKSAVDFSKSRIYITQGFIGSTVEGISTTLGREGSDFSAAILAFSLDCSDVTIWKDVPGVLNADPKWFDDTVKIDRMSYYDATELAYYGASVIHPKTIKPLHNKHIPLYVKSFLNPESEGTIITSDTQGLPVPSFIFKINQVLFTISPKDFSFIGEENLRDIFQILAELNIKINVMQNTAMSFSLCVNDDERKIPVFINRLSEKFTVKYNNSLELVTIRHYDQKTIERVTVNKDILLEEKSRHNIQMVMRNIVR
ncbi:MAG: aspartate kinase [Spirochaetes bacterium]|nr:aspartate kinase [Spirochaetota bacterium]